MPTVVPCMPTTVQPEDGCLPSGCKAGAGHYSPGRNWWFALRALDRTDPRGLGAGALLAFPLSIGRTFQCSLPPPSRRPPAPPPIRFGSLLIPMLLMLGDLLLLPDPAAGAARQGAQGPDECRAPRRYGHHIRRHGRPGHQGVRHSDEVEVELAENLKVRIIKSTLMDVRSKGEPVKE